MIVMSDHDTHEGAKSNQEARRAARPDRERKKEAKAAKFGGNCNGSVTPGLGDRLWVVDVIAPFGGHEEMLKDLKAEVFPDQAFKFCAMVDGRPGVREI